MLIKNLPADGDDCWGIAWRPRTHGSKRPQPIGNLISDSQDNLRMQTLPDWANEGYEPASNMGARSCCAISWRTEMKTLVKTSELTLACLKP